MEETQCRGFACLRGMRKIGAWSIINGFTVGVGHSTGLIAMVMGLDSYSR